MRGKVPLLLLQLFDVALQNDRREDGGTNAPLQLGRAVDLLLDAA